MKKYLLKSGKEYYAENYVKDKNADFKIISNFLIKFNDNSFTKFNRFSLKYKCDKPLKMFISYEQDGKSNTHYYFLEDGEKTFNGLIYDYLDGKFANKVFELNFSTFDGEQAEFSISDFTVEDFKVYNEVMYYIEGKRYKLGVRLIWGGGIGYVEDKTCKINGLKNLVNQHDVGRLIQQSYYIASDSKDYSGGYFINHKWRYNPVQGGDQHENHSKLIDLAVKDNCVYIKSQPQDWSLDGNITPSYMENTYTVLDDVIRVDNRFIDYSGYKKIKATQEVPAFYTVSYLDTFTFYNGDNPWQKEKLQTEENLEFWGDNKYAFYCRFRLDEKNSETWCAWYNKKDNFGMGLYVPNIGYYFAGRSLYDGSKNPDDDPTNYVAPEAEVKIETFKPIKYSYLISCGSIEEIRDTVYKYRNFVDNSLISVNDYYLRSKKFDYTNVSFDKVETAKRVVNTSNFKWDKKKKALLFNSKTFNTFTLYLRASTTKIYSKDYSKIEFEYIVKSKHSEIAEDGFRFYVAVGDVYGIEKDKAIYGKYICDGKAHKEVFDLSKYSWYNGEVRDLIFFAFNNVSEYEEVYIKSIKFLK